MERRGPGLLKITAHKARGLQDADWFGKSDPYVKASVGGEKLKGKPHNGGGKNPFWEQGFSFTLDLNDKNLGIEVWDEDTLKDDFMAKVTLSIDDVLCKRNCIPTW